ncbi:hypothetical protein QEH52_20110, partial [Coraliomargarita sp. SDUM461003]
SKMNRFRPIVALVYLMILYRANLVETLPGDTTGCAFSYSGEAKIFVGFSLMLSLFQTLVSIKPFESKNEKEKGSAFEWFAWTVATTALILFMIFQQKGADPNRAVQLAMLLPILILTLPKRR